MRGSVTDTGYGVYGKAGNGGGVYGTTTGGSGVSGVATTGTGVFGKSDGDGGSKGVHGRTAIGYGVYGEATATGGYGVTGIATDAFGVLGQSGSGTGVEGTSSSATGVLGSGATGVFGSGTSIGISGFSSSGISGFSSSGTGVGVKGVSTTGSPVVGQVTGAANQSAAVAGTGTLGPGVQGQSTGGHGLVGITTAGGGHAGLLGFGNAVGAVGLRGSAVGVGYAGVFDGAVAINGALQVYGAPKSAAVRHPDGSHRLLYCVESPESWFEDFGRGKLKDGKAEVKLDGDFAALVHSDDYHVFLTRYGEEGNGLTVAQMRPDGFTVKEVNKGTGDHAFSYRVVAKRKDIAGERLAKVEPPPALKAPTAFTVPETPPTKAPELPKKP